MGIEGRKGVFGAIHALFKQKSSFLTRPPYAREDENFEACRECEGMCLSVCEENIIQRDESGSVFLNFKTSGCSDCQQCLEACTPSVLSDPERFIQGHAKISMNGCFSHNNTVCFACKEPCMDDAIVFNGMFNPIVVVEKCTGCGYCISVCSTGAIEMAPHKS